MSTSHLSYQPCQPYLVFNLFKKWDIGIYRWAIYGLYMVIYIYNYVYLYIYMCEYKQMFLSRSFSLIYSSILSESFDVREPWQEAPKCPFNQADDFSEIRSSSSILGNAEDLFSWRTKAMEGTSGMSKGRFHMLKHHVSAPVVWCSMMFYDVLWCSMMF
jgi:hypothetical protein